MNEDVIVDLKQFIAAAVSQQTSNITARLDRMEDRMATKDDLARLEAKVDDIQTSIGDALSAGNDATDAQLKDHERRITRLEHKPA